jgi:hypothetical protein
MYGAGRLHLHRPQMNLGSHEIPYRDERHWLLRGVFLYLPQEAQNCILWITFTMQMDDMRARIAAARVHACSALNSILPPGHEPQRRRQKSDAPSDAPSV